MLLGLILVAGLLGGHLFRRVFRMPITGFVVTGVLLGPSALNLLSPGILDSMRIVVDVAVGLILFELGRRVDFAWLRRERWLLATGIAECTLSFLFMYYTLTWFGVANVLAAMGAAIGVCTSPAVVLLVSRDLKAEGQVTERVLSLVAINSAFALVLFTLCLSYLHVEHASGWLTAVMHPLYLVAGSVALGSCISLAIVALCRLLGRREDVQFILLVGMMVLAIGLANQFKVSVLLTLLLIGAMTRNLDRHRAVTAVEFGPVAQLSFVVLFVYAGATLVLSDFQNVVGIAFAYIGARFLAKSIAVFALSRVSGMNRKQSGLVCIALVPMSGFAIVMVQSAARLYPDFGVQLASIVLAVVAILDLVGPLATQFSLRRAGEASPVLN